MGMKTVSLIDVSYEGALMRRIKNSYMLKLLCILLLAVASFNASFASDTTVVKNSDTSISVVVPSGFSITTIIPSLGKNRHIAVSPNGDIYVKLADRVEGKGIAVLRESNGKATVVNRF